MDIVAIDDLAIECVIGDDPDERERIQIVYVSVELETDFTMAARSDALSDAIDYRELSQRLTAIAVDGKFRLIESLASAMLAECLADPRVKSARVQVKKPDVPPGASAARAICSAAR